MNCKKGDLAIVVKSWNNNEGKIVRCVRFVGKVEFQYTGVESAWEVDPPLFNEDGKNVPTADSQLRPLKAPGAGETDEMLLIVKPPVKKTLETTK